MAASSPCFSTGFLCRSPWWRLFFNLEPFGIGKWRFHVLPEDSLGKLQVFGCSKSQLYTFFQSNHVSKKNLEFLVPSTKKNNVSTPNIGANFTNLETVWCLLSSKSTKLKLQTFEQWEIPYQASSLCLSQNWVMLWYKKGDAMILLYLAKLWYFTNLDFPKRKGMSFP